MFPGAANNPNVTISDLQKVIRNSVKCIGFTLNYIAGNYTITNLRLPSDAKLFLGFALTYDEAPPANRATLFNLIINNEKLIEDVHPTFFMPIILNGISDDGYYKIERPLNNTDKINAEVLGVGIGDLRMIIYYL